MEYLKNSNGLIVIAVDETSLFYLNQEPFENSDLSEEEIKNIFLHGETNSLAIKYLENDNGYKLTTILEYMKENELLSDSDNIWERLKGLNKSWNEMISGYEKSIEFYENNRIVLLEIEVSGHASSFMNKLSLIIDDSHFELMSSVFSYNSASENIEYFGLEYSEFWDHTLGNGETIDEMIGEIITAEDLHAGIINLLSCERWLVSAEEIPWKSIVDSLTSNRDTYEIGLALSSIVYN